MKMKLLLLTLLIPAIGLCQDYKPMNSRYQFNDSLRLSGVQLDTADYDTTNGFYLKINPIPTPEGYFNVILDSVASGSGTVTGSGVSSRVAYWSSPSALTSNTNVNINGGTLELQASDALTLIGDNRRIKFIDGAGTDSNMIYKTSTNLIVQTGTSEGFKILNSLGEPVISTDAAGSVILNEDLQGHRLQVMASTDTALAVSPTGDGFVGIRKGAPTSALHIEGGALTEILIALDNNAYLSPGGASPGSLGNVPVEVAGTQPDRWLAIYLDGVRYVFPVYLAPE